MGVESGVGEGVDVTVVHGQEDLAGLGGGADASPGCDLAAAGLDLEPVTRGNSEEFGVVRVDFQPEVGGVEFSENGGLAGARFSVPLGAGAATC